MVQNLFETAPFALFSAPGLEQSYSISVLKTWFKNDPGHGLPRLGARGSGLGAGAGLILDYREISSCHPS